MNARIYAFTLFAFCLPLFCGAQSDEELDASQDEDPAQSA